MNVVKKLLAMLLIAVFVLVPLSSCGAQLKLPKEEVVPEVEKKSYGERLRESTKVDPLYPDAPSEDEEFNVLLIGNSYSTHWPDELLFLFDAAGYENVKVCNIYHSGATFEEHWTWFQNGEDAESFYIHRTGQTQRTELKKVGWEECVTYANWDVISFQEGNQRIGNTDKYRLGISQWLPQIFTYLYAYFPEAIYYWQQNWAHEIGKDSYTSIAKVEERTNFHRQESLRVCEEWDFINVPLGSAWLPIRHDPMFFSFSGDVENDYPTKSLHLRVYESTSQKGTITNADLSHDGNIGGGQYLNACVWFEMLTHKSVLDIDTAPVYIDVDGNALTLTAEQREALQNAAHQAVLADYGEEWYK